MDDKQHIEILGLHDGRPDERETLAYTIEEASIANSTFDRAKGINFRMLPKRLADLGQSEWA